MATTTAVRAQEHQRRRADRGSLRTRYAGSTGVQERIFGRSALRGKVEDVSESAPVTFCSRLCSERRRASSRVSVVGGRAPPSQGEGPPLLTSAIHRQ